jgi:N-acylneuraminate cytidylyltransferase
MKIITIIPARGGSKGIPGKNLIDLNGKPLIAWSIEQALKSKLVDEVWVSSDDNNILKESIKYGASIIIRPSIFATDTATTETAIKHAIEYIKYDNIIIVLLQATAPLRLYDDIDNAIKQFKTKNLDSLLSVTPTNNFIWHIVDNKPESITYDYKNRQMRQNISNKFLENGSIYIFKSEILFKYNNRLGGNIGMYVMKDWQDVDIDNYNDLELCKLSMRKYMKC